MKFIRHAIMVMGYGDYRNLQETINLFDDYDIDFIVHWDKKYPLPNLYSYKSKIIFLKNRIKINWGSDTQTIAEKLLMQKVVEMGVYDYVHLISSSDIPMMTLNYFKTYFKKDTYYIGFIDYLEKRIYNQYNEYYPIRHIKVKNRFSIIVLIHYINKLFKVNRLKGIHVEKGCNWFSMDIKYVKEVLNFNKFYIFMNTSTGDEFYIQTILQRLKPKNLNRKYNYYSDEYRMTMTSKMALRYIDWFRGKPYIFKECDILELKSKINTQYAFARKINDPSIIPKIYF